MYGPVFWFLIRRFYYRVMNRSKRCKMQVDMPVCYMELFDWFYWDRNHQHLCRYMCEFAFWCRTRRFWCRMRNQSKGHIQQLGIFEYCME